MVAIVAVHGMYNRQNTIREYALAVPNPIPLSVEARTVIPAVVVTLPIPKSTLQLETTTSFAAIPAMSATTICQ